MTYKELPQCAVLPCTNTADPRWFARDVNGYRVMICDGHLLPPQANEVASCPPETSAQDIAARVVRNGYSPTPGEVERIAQELLAEVSLAKEHAAELSELRDLAKLVNDANLSELPPELRAVQQRWREARYNKEVVRFINIGRVEKMLSASLETSQEIRVIDAKPETK